MATHFMQADEHTSLLDNIPQELPILPLRNTLMYPFVVMPLGVGMPRSVKLIEETLQGNRLIGLVAMKDASVQEPMPDQVFETGTIGAIQHVSRSPDNALQVVVQGIERFRIDQWLGSTPYLRARIVLAPEVVTSDTETDALQRSLRELIHDVMELSPQVPKEVRDFLTQVQDPRYLAYLVAANARLELQDGQQLLEADDLKDKFHILITHLTREKEVLALGHKIQSEAREEMDKAQREYYLRQQLKAIQRELGEADETQALSEAYRQKIEAASLPEEAQAEALRELNRLQSMPPRRRSTRSSRLTSIGYGGLTLEHAESGSIGHHPCTRRARCRSLRSPRDQRSHYRISRGAAAAYRAQGFSGEPDGRCRP
jgi:ATP-dependent Lon protease